MSHLLYLGLLAAILLVTLPLELAIGARVYRRPRRLFACVAPVSVVFIGWDGYAVKHHQWSYDPAYLVGARLPAAVLQRLPIEEVLFFLIVPVCAILGFEAVRRVTGWSAGDER